jgi:glycine/D-amino acid oxidase-like deaminating enzyme/nitrite reductase/ring-hydroxylating ferredoxin subunit
MYLAQPMSRARTRRTPDFSGETVSNWMEFPAGDFPSLEGDTSTSVCVIGAGIAGLTTAYLLIEKGKQVVVVDDGAIGGGETSRTTAHLVTAIDDRFFHIASWRGEENARLAMESQIDAIDAIERIVRREAIDCDFARLDGYLFPQPGESSEEIEKEHKTAQRSGLTDAEIVDRAPLASFDTGRALRFPRQAQFHPMKYLDGLAKAIVRRSGQIFTHTHVEELDEDRLIAVANGHQIRAQDIVIATNAPIWGPGSNDVMQAPYRTFVIAATIPTKTVSRGLFWDTGWPYHYVRFQPFEGDSAKELLIVGGEDHKTGQADDADERWQTLEDWTRERFPMMEKVRFRWSGQVQETVDGLGLIGRQKEDGHVYQITGDSGLGMTNSTIGGMLVSDLIVGAQNSWTDLYNPLRKPVRALGEIMSEGINVAVQYAKKVTPAEAKTARGISEDSGEVVDHSHGKTAVYRDKDGGLHEFSAVCPHRGCILAWNSAEKTWDCPCHGSRFDRFGKVVTGPAMNHMKPAPKKTK